MITYYCRSKLVNCTMTIISVRIQFSKNVWGGAPTSSELHRFTAYHHLNQSVTVWKGEIHKPIARCKTLADNQLHMYRTRTVTCPNYGHVSAYGRVRGCHMLILYRGVTVTAFKRDDNLCVLSRCGQGEDSRHGVVRVWVPGPVPSTKWSQVSWVVGFEG